MKWDFRYAQFSGEVFIDSDGNAMGAGDDDALNHEANALQMKLPDELFFKYNASHPDEIFALYQQGKLEPEDVQEIGKDFLDYMVAGGEARSWMVEKEGWIRVHGANFEVGQLNGQTINAIANYVYEETDSRGDPNQYEIAIEETSTGAFANFTAAQVLEAADNPDQLSRMIMQLRRNRFGSNKLKIKFAQANWNEQDLMKMVLMAFDLHPLADSHPAGRFKLHPANPLSNGRLHLLNESGQISIKLIIVSSKIFQGYEGWFTLADRDGEFAHVGPMEWSAEEFRKIPNEIVQRAYQEIDKYRDQGGDDDEPTWEPEPEPTMGVPVPSVMSSNRWSYKYGQR